MKKKLSNIFLLIVTAVLLVLPYSSVLAHGDNTSPTVESHPEDTFESQERTRTIETDCEESDCVDYHGSYGMMNFSNNNLYWALVSIATLSVGTTALGLIYILINMRNGKK